jgi:hypothetical protein
MTNRIKLIITAVIAVALAGEAAALVYKFYFEETVQAFNPPRSYKGNREKEAQDNNANLIDYETLQWSFICDHFWHIQIQPQIEGKFPQGIVDIKTQFDETGYQTAYVKHQGMKAEELTVCGKPYLVKNNLGIREVRFTVQEVSIGNFIVEFKKDGLAHDFDNE